MVVVLINPSKDNTLYEDDGGSLSNGGGQHVFVGKTGDGSLRRGLIAFNVGANLPAGATIHRAALTLNMSLGGARAETVGLHRVTADWGEGSSDASGAEGAGTDAAGGDATWLNTFFDMTRWATAGGDFLETESAAVAVGSEATYTWDSSGMAADVQAWLHNPSSNFGWVLLGNEGTEGTAKRFDSRENLPPENRPMLTVAFTIAEEPAPTPTPLAPTTGDMRVPSGTRLAFAALGLVLALGGLGLLMTRRGIR